jgi:hypothetical protein
MGKGTAHTQDLIFRSALLPLTAFIRLGPPLSSVIARTFDTYLNVPAHFYLNKASSYYPLPPSHSHWYVLVQLVCFVPDFHII